MNQSKNSLSSIASLLLVVSHAGAQSTTPVEPIRLPTLEVEAQRSADFTVSSASTATKTDTPALETPFTLQVLPQAVLSDLGRQQDLGTAMQYLGVPTEGVDNYVAGYYYRGFASTGLLWNGFKIEEATTTAGPGVGPVWMDNVNRLELMRGPASILYGQVEPGGVLNVITEKPRAELGAEVSAGVGSWSDRWGSLAVTGPLTRDKNVLGRVLLSAQSSGSYFTYSPDYKSVGIAPALTWRITPKTSVAFEGQYRDVEGETWQQSYAFSDPVTGEWISAPLADSRWPDSVGKWKQARSMLSLEHRFNSDWALSLKAMEDKIEEPWAYYQYANSADFSTQAPGVLIVDRALLYNRSFQKTRAATFDLLGHFKTKQVQHTLLLGGDVYDQEFPSSFGGSWDGNPTNLYEPTSGRLETPDYTSNTLRFRQGLYLQDQLALDANWHVLAGLRYDRIREQSFTDDVATIEPYRVTRFTPRAGLLWKPGSQMSLYYSYAENQGQGQGFEYPGVPLKPEFSKQHEVGAKTVWLGGKLIATASLFELTKQNIASGDPDPTHLNFVIGVGEVRSRGFETNFQGSLNENVQLVANYSYARPVVIKGVTGAAIGGNYSPDLVEGDVLHGVPLHNASTWISCKLPWKKGLTVGGGANWHSASTSDSTSINLVTGENVHTEAYWVASLFIKYETTIAGRRTLFQLNVDNLFDKVYATSSNAFGGFGVNSRTDYFGDPRSFKFEIRTDF